MGKLIYLDNNATTRPLPEVVDAMLHALRDGFGNPNSIHPAGEAARKLVEDAREKVAGLLSCRSTEVVFTSCATESINTALRGAIAASRISPPRLLITAVEHEAVIDLANVLKAAGTEVEVLPVDSGGGLRMDVLKEALAKPASLLSIMAANNETGRLFPIAEVARLAREADVPVHVDAVQMVGKVPLDVTAWGVDFLSLSGHKFYAPKGVGVLYVRRGARFRSFMVGAGQEKSRRGGTENVPGIVGLGVAADHMVRGIPERSAHLKNLGERLEAGLLAIPDSRRNGAASECLPGTVNVSFRGIEGSAVVLTAAREGVCLSAGSACSATQYGGSHVLEAMGVPYEYLHGAVRVSCGQSNTQAEVAEAVAVIRKSVEYLRTMNPEGASRRREA
jgi:cysteine desulfurase